MNMPVISAHELNCGRSEALFAKPPNRDYPTNITKDIFRAYYNLDLPVLNRLTSVTT